MNLFRRCELGVSRDEPLGVTFRRVAEVLRGGGVVRVPVRFHLSDRLDIKASGVAAAEARFPWLAPLARGGGPREPRTLDNLDPRFQGGRRDSAPVDADVLAPVVDEIPARLPFGRCLFLFEGAPWMQHDGYVPALPGGRGRSPILATATGAFHAEAEPGLVLAAEADTRRVRKRTITSTIAIAPPAPDATELARLDPAVAHALARIGKSSREEILWQVAVADRAALREANLRLQEIARRWDAERDDVIRRLPLPHPDLPVEPGPSTGHGYTSPHKEALIAAFAPRGYAYRAKASGQGVFKLSKPTARGNRMSIEVDVGSWSHKASCTLRVEGPTWSNGLGVTFGPGQRAGGYNITSDAVWPQMVANAAEVVAYLEDHYVPELEAARDPTPRWWRFPP